jgi:hypothetical protein
MRVMSTVDFYKRQHVCLALEQSSTNLPLQEKEKLTGKYLGPDGKFWALDTFSVSTHLTVKERGVGN